MKGLRPILAVITADSLQRWRSPGYWLVLGLLCLAVTWSLPPADARYLVLAVQGHSRAAYGSAWVGLVAAMMSVWLSLLGFYVVRHALLRDWQTGVWQLAVATPMSRGGYLLAKWLGNWAVLVSMSLATLATAALLQQWRGEDTRLDLWELCKPTVLIAWPSLALAAACAVAFDVVPPLRRTVGSLVYFMLWVGLVALGAAGMSGTWPHGWPGDPRGLMVVQDALRRQIEPQLSAPWVQGFCMACGLGSKTLTLVQWPQWLLAPGVVSSRLAWVAFSGLLAWAWHPLLDRWAARAPAATESRSGLRLAWLDALLSPALRRSWALPWALEVQATLRARGRGWWAAALACSALGAVAPTPVAALAVLGSGLLLLDLQSGALLREREARAESLVYSLAGQPLRVLAVRWALLVALGLGFIAPALLRFLFTEPMVALCSVVVVVSTASWGLALAAATGHTRLFELLTALLAYLAVQRVGVLNVSVTPALTALGHLAALPVAVFLLWRWVRRHRPRPAPLVLT